MSGYAGTASCETFVEALGLKSLFSTLMGKAGKKDKNPTLAAGEETVHILGIVSSLFTNLPSDSPARIRVLAKFVDGNYEKVDKLLEIREGAQARLKAVEKEIDAERKVSACVDLRSADSDEEVGTRR
jgi:beta-catenin-like protein 1